MHKKCLRPCSKVGVCITDSRRLNVKLRYLTGGGNPPAAPRGEIGRTDIAAKARARLSTRWRGIHGWTQ